MLLRGVDRARPLCMDSEPESPHGASLRPTNPAEDHVYRTIGRALSGAEASFPNVGLPWMPPTRRVRGLQEDGDLDDYLRVNLVEVKLVALQEYVDDLRTAEPAAFEGALYISSPSSWERHALSLLVFVGTVVATWLVALGAEIAPLSAFMLAAIVGGGSAMAASVFSTDEFRRTSFLGALDREIERRNGQSGSGSNNLQVCPTGG